MLCADLGTMCVSGACKGQRMVSAIWNWSCRWLLATMWVLGTEPGSSAKAANALTAEPFLQLLLLLFDRRLQCRDAQPFSLASARRSTSSPHLGI